MEGTKPRTASSIGMFDMLKGAGMLTIVFAHTAELYPMQAVSGLSLTAFFPFIYREALMAAFFIASGYGFRKRSIHKCIEQQLKTLLKPYVYTALATTVLHAFIHHAAFGSWDAAISESAKVLGGFLLGLPHTATYFGQQFFSCGPMWYLVALMLAWVLLDVLLEIFPERYITPAVVGVTLLGWGVTLVWEDAEVHATGPEWDIALMRPLLIIMSFATLEQVGVAWVFRDAVRVHATSPAAGQGIEQFAAYLLTHPGGTGKGTLFA